MLKTYSKTGELLNIVYSIDEQVSFGRTDITDAKESLQCGIIYAEGDKVFSPHKHVDRINNKIHIQEAFIILRGVARIVIYDFDNEVIASPLLKKGDLCLLVAGGHSLQIVEDCLLYEIKNGPYEGQEKDKIFI